MLQTPFKPSVPPLRTVSMSSSRRVILSRLLHFCPMDVVKRICEQMRAGNLDSDGLLF
jgi:hypothetical protein